MTDTTAADLKRLGWKPNSPEALTRAITDYQRGFALPGRPALLVDGKAGPRTQAAIALSLANLKAGKPTASRWFSFSEFRCKCGGKSDGCAVVRVHRALLIGLDQYRTAHGPTTIVSGYRCPARNQKVGGASVSQHVYGAAADIALKAPVKVVQRLRRFSGIGHKGGLVRHVDVRHVSGNNTTGGTPDRPTMWKY